MITNFFLFCNFVAIKLGASIGWARVGAEVWHKKRSVTLLIVHRTLQQN